MQALTSDRPLTPAQSIKKFISVAIILVILLVVALSVNKAYKASQPASLPQGTVTISQSVLEDQYGLRVNLVAVTGAGGFIDLRLKMVDGEKAKQLLTDANNFPALMIGDLILNAPEATKSQKMRFENNAGMYIMYPNSGNALQTGTPVTILFGDTALEPINAK